MRAPRRAAPALGLAVGLLALAPAPVPAQPPPGHALELGLLTGYALPFVGGDAEAEADDLGGPAAALQVRYRSPSGLGGYVEAGFARLAASRSLLPGSRTGELVRLESTLDSWLVTAGLAFDVWRLRLEGGLGLSVLAVRSTLGDATITPSVTNLAYSAALTAFLYEDVVRLGAGVQAVFVSGTDIGYVVLGLRIGGDAIRR